MPISLIDGMRNGNTSWQTMIIVFVTTTMIFLSTFSNTVMAARNINVMVSIGSRGNGSSSLTTITAKNSESGEILASGSDAASVIQAGIDAIRTAGSGTLHIGQGTYRISSTLNMSAINNFVMEGDGENTTILKCIKEGLRMLVKQGGFQRHNITIRNIQFDGNNISGPWMDIWDVKGLTITHVVLQRSNFQGGPDALFNATDAIISNSSFRETHSRGDAIAIVGRNMTFTHNDVTNNTYYCSAGLTSGGLIGADISYNNFHDSCSYAMTSLENFNPFYHVKIHDNIFKNITNGNGILSVGYDTDSTFHDIQIYNNTFVNITRTAIKLNAFGSLKNVDTYNSTIYNNTFSNIHGNAIFAGPLKDSKINGNTIDKVIGGYGIRLYPGSDGVTMDGNKITGASSGKYYYDGSTNIYINGEEKT